MQRARVREWLGGTLPSVHLTHPSSGQRQSDMAADRMERDQKAGSLPRRPGHLLIARRCRSKMTAKSSAYRGCGVLGLWGLQGGHQLG